MRPFTKMVGSLAFAIGAASCGSTDSSTSAEQQMTAPDAAQGQSVTILSYWVEPGDAQGLQALIDVHKKKHRDDTVVIDASTTFDFTAVVQERTAAGNAPDLFTAHPETIGSYLQNYGPTSLQSMTDFFASPERAASVANIYPELLADLTFDGKTYALPLVAARFNTLFYNKHVFAAHNVQPPTTLDELRTVCQTFEVAGVSCLGHWIPTIPLMSVLPAVMGIDGYADFIRGGAPNEPAIRAAVDVLAELEDNFFDPEALQGMPAFGVFDKFMKGSVAMILDGSWSMGPLQQLGWTAGIDFGAMAPPGNAGLFIYSQDVVAIPAGAPHLAGALNFLDSAASLDGVVGLAKYKDSIPVRKDAIWSNANKELLGVIQDMQQAKQRVPVGAGSFLWAEAVKTFSTTTPRDKEGLVQAILGRR